MAKSKAIELTIEDKYLTIIEPGVSISIITADENGPHTQKFMIGDDCISGSYNFIYVDKITAITAKNVSVEQAGYAKSKRIKIDKFVRRNSNFDIDQINEHNNRVSMSI